jgi:predicted dinucleotide-binding enzyme
MSMRAGVIGSGDVGRVLGAGLAGIGYEVKLGSRDPESVKLKEWQAKTRAKTGTFAEAAAFGDLIVLATSWSGTHDAIEMAGIVNFGGKVVIDATNPLAVAPNAPPSLALGHTDSGGEQVQRWLPVARVVKCFNSVGNAHMVHPDFPGGPPDMFLCGNDQAAKETVIGICKAFGWGTIDVGGIEGSRLLEPLCILWVIHGIRGGGWNHAFKLLHK